MSQLTVVISAWDHKPMTVTLTHCPKCGQIDRDEPLRANHYDHGYRCGGRPERHTYTLTRVDDCDYEGGY